MNELNKATPQKVKLGIRLNGELRARFRDVADGVDDDQSAILCTAVVIAAAEFLADYFLPDVLPAAATDIGQLMTSVMMMTPR